MTSPSTHRSRLLAMVEDAVEAEAEDNGEVAVEDKEEVEAKEATEELEEARVKVVKDKVRVVRAIHATRLSVMRTSPPSSPAFVTGPSGKVLISAWNQAPALGKTPGYQNQTNETLTSSTIKTTLKSFMICCIVTSYQKYIH